MLWFDPLRLTKVRHLQFPPFPWNVHEISSTLLEIAPQDWIVSDYHTNMDNCISVSYTHAAYDTDYILDIKLCYNSYILIWKLYKINTIIATLLKQENDYLLIKNKIYLIWEESNCNIHYFRAPYFHPITPYGANGLRSMKGVSCLCGQLQVGYWVLHTERSKYNFSQYYDLFGQDA